ncbi:MAG: GTPase Era [Lachnospiraceae bacterium]|nr:GTPase Era [Lachnospiraceae bacterium]
MKDTMMNNMQVKSGYAAIIGRPNVGKSTLMNRIIGQKIAITSNKPQTTRNRIMTIFTDERGQIVFLDTPGINQAKNKLGEYMLGAALRTIQDADVVLWLVEPTNYIGKGEQYILSELKKIDLPVILAMNKTDSVEKDQILEFINTYSKEFDFAEIVPVSAKTGDNVDTLMEQIFKYLPYGPMFYDPDELTDQPVKQIAAETIREKALYCLDEEVPHGIAVVIDTFHERERTKKLEDGTVRKEPIIDIEATIICEKDSHKGIVIGKKGAMLKKIGILARKDIEKLTECKVNLKLWVKVRKEWRDSDSQLRNFGYDSREV